MKLLAIPNAYLCPGCGWMVVLLPMNPREEHDQMLKQHGTIVECRTEHCPRHGVKLLVPFEEVEAEPV